MFLGGFATLGIPVLVHLLTLPTEFDASFNRALPMLSAGPYIPPEDIPAAKKTASLIDKETKFLLWGIDGHETHEIARK